MEVMDYKAFSAFSKKEQYSLLKQVAESSVQLEKDLLMILGELHSRYQADELKGIERTLQEYQQVKNVLFTNKKSSNNVIEVEFTPIQKRETLDKNYFKNKDVEEIISFFTSKLQYPVQRGDMWGQTTCEFLEIYIPIIYNIEKSNNKYLTPEKIINYISYKKAKEILESQIHTNKNIFVQEYVDSNKAALANENIFGYITMNIHNSIAA